MKAKVVSFLGLTAMIYGWACNPYPAPVPPTPSVAPSLTPVVGRTYTYSQPGGSLKFRVDALAGDSVTYTLTMGDKSTSGLVTKRTFGVYWVLQQANPLTQDISSYPADTTTTGVGTYATNRVNVNVDHVYWIAQGIVVKALEGTTISTLGSLE